MIESTYVPSYYRVEDRRGDSQRFALDVVNETETLKFVANYLEFPLDFAEIIKGNDKTYPSANKNLILDQITIFSTNPNLGQFLPFKIRINDIEVEFGDDSDPKVLRQVRINRVLYQKQTLQNLAFSEWTDRPYYLCNQPEINSDPNVDLTFNGGMFVLDNYLYLSTERLYYRIDLDLDPSETVLEKMTTDPSQLAIPFIGYTIIPPVGDLQSVYGGYRNPDLNEFYPVSLESEDNSIRYLCSPLGPVLSVTAGDPVTLSVFDGNGYYLYNSDVDTFAHIAIVNQQGQIVLDLVQDNSINDFQFELPTRVDQLTANEIFMFNTVGLYSFFLDYDNKTFEPRFALFTGLASSDAWAFAMTRGQLASQFEEGIKAPFYAYSPEGTLYTLEGDQNTGQVNVLKTQSFGQDWFDYQIFNNFMVIKLFDGRYVVVNLVDGEVTVTDTQVDRSKFEYRYPTAFTIGTNYWVEFTTGVMFEDLGFGALSLRVSPNDRLDSLGQVFKYTFNYSERFFTIDSFNDLKVDIDPLFNVQNLSQSIEIYQIIIDFRLRYSKSKRQTNPAIPIKDACGQGKRRDPVTGRCRKDDSLKLEIDVEEATGRLPQDFEVSDWLDVYGGEVTREDPVNLPLMDEENPANPE